jgi:hypothetical protein
MADKHPVETKMRALILYLDAHSVADIAEHLGIGEGTVRRWISQGIEIEGVLFPWALISEIVAPNRGAMSSKLAADKQEKWLAYQTGFDADATSDLAVARKKLVAGLESGSVELKAADLPKIIQTEMLLQGKATKIISQSMTITTMVGELVAQAANKHIKDPRLKELVLDEVKQGFYRLTGSVNEKDLAKRGGG